MKKDAKNIDDIKMETLKEIKEGDFIWKVTIQYPELECKASKFKVLRILGYTYYLDNLTTHHIETAYGVHKSYEFCKDKEDDMEECAKKVLDSGIEFWQRCIDNQKKIIAEAKNSIKAYKSKIKKLSKVKERCGILSNNC